MWGDGCILLDIDVKEWSRDDNPITNQVEIFRGGLQCYAGGKAIKLVCR